MIIKVLKKARKVIEEEITHEIDLEFPTEHKFYKMNDDGRMFARGIVLFAITIKYSHTFLVFEIERGKQYFADFVPKSDCSSEYWLTDSNDIRRTALKLLKGEHTPFEEIKKEEFLELRRTLLDNPLQNVL